MDILSFLFSFRGRVNRRAYWAFYLFYSAIGLGFFYVLQQDLLKAELTPGMNPDEFARAMGGMRFGWLNLVNLVLLWPSIAVGVKRLHDRNYSGWFFLVLFVPLLQLWPIVVMAFLRGTEGDNRFGPDPLAGRPAESWKSWAIFAGFLVILSLQGSLAFNMVMYMKDRMPPMQAPQMPAPDGGLRSNPV